MNEAEYESSDGGEYLPDEDELEEDEFFTDDDLIPSSDFLTDIEMEDVDEDDEVEHILQESSTGCAQVCPLCSISIVGMTGLVCSPERFY